MEASATLEALKQMGFGALLGFMVGFTFKRILKLLFFVIGIYVISLIWLADAGFLSVKWEAIGRSISSLLASADDFTRGAVRTLSFGGSFAAGFV